MTQPCWKPCEQVGIGHWPRAGACDEAPQQSQPARLDLLRAYQGVAT